MPAIIAVLLVSALCLLGLSVVLGAAYMVYGPRRRRLLDFMALSFSVGVLVIVAVIVYAVVISAEGIFE